MNSQGYTPRYTLNGDIYTDIRAVLDGTTSCWIATRINGASASMACDQAPVDTDLLQYLDGRFGHMVMDHGIKKPWETYPRRS